jgi:hypothetical protein
VVRGKSSLSSPKKDGEKDQSSLEEGDSIVGALQIPTAKTKPPKVKRSVSFQDDVEHRKDSSSSVETQNRRKEYRKSSGYGTGSAGSNASLQSQMSNTSNMSQENESEGRTEVGRSIEGQPGVNGSLEPVRSGLMYEGDKRGVHIIPVQRRQPAIQEPVDRNGQFSANDNSR